MALSHSADSMGPRHFGISRLPVRGVLLLAIAAGACDTKPENAAPSSSSTGQPGMPQEYGIGHTPSAAQIAAIDIDANPAGAGLPAGHGTAGAGAALYAQKCAMCHGPHGQGQGPYPKLIGQVPPAGFTFARDPAAPKTIGNYWPYATTVYDYVHRAMPYNAPGSLTPSETYSVVAYLLSENGLVPASTVIDATTLPAVKMPGRSHFVPDNRTGGRPFR